MIAMQFVSHMHVRARMHMSNAISKSFGAKSYKLIK